MEQRRKSQSEGSGSEPNNMERLNLIQQGLEKRQAQNPEQEKVEDSQGQEVEKEQEVENLKYSKAQKLQLKKLQKIKQKEVVRFQQVKAPVVLQPQHFSQFKQSIAEEFLHLLIKKHEADRKQLNIRVKHNMARLGQFTHANNWIDGYEYLKVKRDMKDISIQIQQLRQQIDHKQQGDAQKDLLNLKLFILQSKQKYLNQTFERLQQEIMIHINQMVFVSYQSNCKFATDNPKKKQIYWPKIGNYQLLKLIGSGGCSQVYKGYDIQNSREVALKLHQCFTWDTYVRDKIQKSTKEEQNIHKRLFHPNIVQYYGNAKSGQNISLSVLQLCQGPDLSQLIGKLKKIPEKEARIIIKQVVSAIKYLHQPTQDIIHYDLKPANIILHKGGVKISDFGLSKQLRQVDSIKLTQKGVGTLMYLPPECFSKDQIIYVNNKVDIWSLGIIYYEMLFGKRPFKNTQQSIFEREAFMEFMNKEEILLFPTQNKVSQNSKSFIQACLKYDVNKRSDIQQLSKHPLICKQ